MNLFQKLEPVPSSYNHFKLLGYDGEKDMLENVREEQQRNASERYYARKEEQQRKASERYYIRQKAAEVEQPGERFRREIISPLTEAQPIERRLIFLEPNDNLALERIMLWFRWYVCAVGEVCCRPSGKN